MCYVLCLWNGEHAMLQQQVPFVFHPLSAETQSRAQMESGLKPFALRTEFNGTSINLAKSLLRVNYVRNLCDFSRGETIQAHYSRLFFFPRIFVRMLSACVNCFL